MRSLPTVLRYGLGQLGLSGLMAGACCAAEPTTGMPEVVNGAATTIQIIPWIEVNSPDPSGIDHAVEGLLVWKRVTDTAIVSTIPGLAGIYREFRRRVPQMRIIPGIKTNDALPQLDSVDGWRTVGQQIRAVCDASGQTIVVLENESASKRYVHGEYEIDLDRLRRGLQQLPDGVEIIWYPSVTGASVAQQQRGEDLCRVVADVLDVRFIDLSLNCPAAVRYKWSKLGRARLEKLARKPTIPMLYCYGPGSRWWMDEQIPDALTHVKGGWVILYPGGKRWPEAARSITRILAESASLRVP